MGMFDTVYVSGEVALAFDLRCTACGRQPRPEHEWNTKSLDPCMVSYALCHDDQGTIRLYLLDRPSDRRYWRPWSEEEIAESEANAERGGLFSLLVKRRGEGTFLPEAYLPENRRHRFLGELPHQWVEIGTGCPCESWIERWIKFADGVAVECRHTPPRHDPGLFDEASEFE